jgi:hypothetical protein
MRLVSGVGSTGSTFLACGNSGGRGIEERKQHAEDEQRLGQDVAHGPEEVHALQEAEEQRRIAQRRERAARVRDDEDEEHDHVHRCMRLSLARISGRISSIDAPVVPMTLASTAPIARIAVFSPGCRAGCRGCDATRHGEQRREQDDEGDVLLQQRMHELSAGQREAVHRGERQQESQRPAGRDLAVVVCQKLGASSGNNAIDSRMPANGTPHSAESWPPLNSAAEASAGSSSNGSAAALGRIFFFMGPNRTRPVRTAFSWRVVRSRRPGEGRPGISRPRTCSWTACPTAWPRAGRCSGSS